MSGFQDIINFIFFVMNAHNRVLVVDDDQFTLKVMKTLYKQLNIEVVLIDNGEAAFQEY